MDPYDHIKAKYPGLLRGDVRGVALAILELPPEDIYRVANDLHWLLAEVERLRAVEEAAREVLLMWDRTLPEGVGIEFFSTLIGLRDALAGA